VAQLFSLGRVRVRIHEQACQKNRMKKQSVVNWSGLLLAVLLLSGCSHSSSHSRTTPATESIKGQYIAPSQLVDAGNTTPEAALESVFWASANGNYDAVIDAYIPQMRKQVEGWYGNKAKFIAGQQKKFAQLKGVQIVARKTVANDKVELRYYFEFQNRSFSQTSTNRGDQILTFVKMGGAWKCSEKVSYTTDWDEGSQPEPQPNTALEPTPTAP